MSSGVRIRIGALLKPLTLALGLTLAGAALAPSGAAADTGDEATHLIITYGSGAIHVRPDSLVVDVGVEARASSVDGARRQAATSMRSVIDALGGLRLEALTLDTRMINVSPIYGPGRDDRPPAIVGYSASNHLTVRLEGVPENELAGHGSRIVDAALGAGANQVSSFDVYLSDPTPAEDEALAEAVRDATHDAEVVARAAGVTLAGLASLEQAPGMHLVPRAVTLSAMASTPIEIDDIVVQSNVTAKFAFR